MWLWPLRKQVIRQNDPVFGPIVRHRENQSLWSGEAQFAGQNEAVEIRVFCAPTGPFEHQRKLFQELTTRFVGLQKSSVAPLIKGYNDHTAAYAEQDPTVLNEYPMVRSEEELWTRVTPSVIEIYGGDEPNCDFCFHYETDWPDEEHQLMAIIENWHVVEVGEE